MKKLLLVLLLSFGLIGCASINSLDSIEFSASPAEAETKKISCFRFNSYWESEWGSQTNRPNLGFRSSSRVEHHKW